jgi:hypothetical protein
MQKITLILKNMQGQMSFTPPLEKVNNCSFLWASEFIYPDGKVLRVQYKTDFGNKKAWSETGEEFDIQSVLDVLDVK